MKKENQVARRQRRRDNYDTKKRNHEGRKENEPEYAFHYGDLSASDYTDESDTVGAEEEYGSKSDTGSNLSAEVEELFEDISYLDYPRPFE